MIFLDQPVNTGYSYGDASVNTSPVVGKDVYAFLELFLNRFPQYSDKPFHLSGESYAGTLARTSISSDQDLVLLTRNQLSQIRAKHRQRHLSQEQGT